MTLTKPLNVVVLISGTGSNLQSLVEKCAHGKVPVTFSLVVCDIRNALGLRYAKDSGIPTALVERHRDETREEFCERLLAVITKVDPELVVLAGFMRVLSREFIAAFSDRIVNIHPSLLPAFRGLKAQEQALRAGVKIAGCSVHLVDAEVDAGPVLAQAAVPVLPTDSVEELTKRILAAEHNLLPAVVAAIARGQITISRQGGTRQIEFAPELNPTASQELLSIDVS